ncbi:MAG: hypothetical protein M3063_02620 [Actinomycetota bacterium]|nr:hypothetical protein [Actinomycetota bacterium]
MTDDRSPIDAVLDLVLYAPIGLALTVGEEVPELAAKGRTLLTARWATARVVGQFAVAQGRKEVRRRTGGAGTPPPPTRSTASGHETVVPAPSAATAEPRHSTNGAVSPAVATEDGAAAPRAEALAIPGYDSLSASQVVQRLAGLAPDELEAVRAYEAATRGRRTILARVSQLQGT